MRSGFDEFKGLLRDVRSLSYWAVGVGIGAPFVGGLLALAPPPWPRQIGCITAVLELVVLILLFQFFAHAPRKRLNLVMRRVAGVFFVALLAYVFVFSSYTFVVPTSGERRMIGFVCTDNARMVYGKDCSLKSNLDAAEYKAPALWKPWSIDVVTDIAMTLWFTAFGALSGVIGLFLIYQRRPVRRRAETERARRHSGRLPAHGDDS